MTNFNEVIEKSPYLGAIPDFGDKYDTYNIDEVADYPAIIKISIRIDPCLKEKTPKEMSLDVYLLSWVYDNVYVCMVALSGMPGNGYRIRKIDFDKFSEYGELYRLEYMIDNSFTPTLLCDVIKKEKQRIIATKTKRPPTKKKKR